MHVIVEGTGMLALQELFSYNLPLSRYNGAKSPLISGTSRNIATFGMPLQYQLVTDRFHIGSFIGAIEALHQP